MRRVNVLQFGLAQRPSDTPLRERDRIVRLDGDEDNAPTVAGLGPAKVALDPGQQLFVTDGPVREAALRGLTANEVGDVNAHLLSISALRIW